MLVWRAHAKVRRELFGFFEDENRAQNEDQGDGDYQG